MTTDHGPTRAGLTTIFLSLMDPVLPILAEGDEPAAGWDARGVPGAPDPSGGPAVTDTDQTVPADDDDVEGHVVTWDVPQLMQLPASGVAPAPVTEKAPRAAPTPTARRSRARSLFGRGAPSPSTG